MSGSPSWSRSAAGFASVGVAFRIFSEGLGTSEIRLSTDREMIRVTRSKVAGKTSQCAERRLDIFPTKNMARIIAARQ